VIASLPIRGVFSRVIDRNDYHHLDAKMTQSKATLLILIRDHAVIEENSRLQTRNAA